MSRSSQEKIERVDPAPPQAKPQRRNTLLGMPGSHGSVPGIENPVPGPTGAHDHETWRPPPAPEDATTPSEAVAEAAPKAAADSDPPDAGGGFRPSGTAPLSERSALAGLAWISDEHPSVLLVGEGHPMQEALGLALARHQVESEVTSLGAVSTAVVAATPKLVLILGDAARGSGKAVLDALRNAELDDAVPIVVLLDEESLEARLEAIRVGASAVIPPSASVDQIARRIADIARAESVDQVRAELLGETVLSELLAAMGRNITARVLPEGSRDVEPRRIHVVFGAGRDVVAILDDFGDKLARKIVRAERTDDSLVPEPEGRRPGQAGRPGVAGLRVVLADDDAARADALADELRQLGATVVVTGLVPQPERMKRIRQADPMVLLVRSEDLETRGQALLQSMKQDIRLRWVTMVVGDWNDLRGPSAASHTIEALVDQIAETGDQDRSLRASAESGGAVDLPLEALGPARALRALATCSKPLRLTIKNARAEIVVDLSEGLIVGATAKLSGEPPRTAEGPAALSALLMLGSGRLSVEAITGPRVLNVMSTVSNALDLAEAEAPPVQPSFPPGALDEVEPEAPVPVPSREGALARLFRTPGSRYVGLAALGTLLVSIGVLIGSTSRSDGPRAPRRESAAQAENTTAKRPPDDAPPAAQVPPPGDPLLDRARAGDVEAMSALESRPVAARTPAETLALAEGRVAKERAEIEALGRGCTDHPELLSDQKTAARWLGLAKNASLAPRALTTLATIPSSAAADLVYAVAASPSLPPSTTQVADELLRSDALRQQMSPALAIALELRAAQSCDQMKDLLPRAIEVADRRSLRTLGHLVGTRNCGPMKNQVCYPCLQKSELVPKAVRAARSRLSPFSSGKP